MLIPHGMGNPLHLSFSVSFILVCLSVWGGITFWATYLSAQHIDYWRSQMSNQVLEMKVKFLTKQLDNSRYFIDEVRQIEAKLKDFLDYKSKYSIIANDRSLGVSSTGGPTLGDQNDITDILNNRNPDLSWKRLIDKVGMMKFEAKEQIKSFEELSKWIEMQRELFRSTPRGWPCPGHLASPYGQRKHPIFGSYEFHCGVDISAPNGTPIRSTSDGVVKYCEWASGYGNLIVIQHKYGYVTRYAHNSRQLVKVGDRVKRDQMIALVGNTGTSTGPHCHYEVWQNNRRLNPYAYLKGDYPQLDRLAFDTNRKKSTPQL